MPAVRLRVVGKVRVSAGDVMDPLLLRWRTGRKVGRTIYAMLGPEPSDTDPLIGLMDTAALAAEACASHNLGLT